jgi:tetratricopeptide (TPR) repeat protein
VARLIGFFVLVWLLASLLGHLPVVGPFFERTSCLGFWVSALLLSWGLGRLSQRAIAVRRDASEVKRQLAVDSPQGHGKVGAMFLAQGRAAKALPHLVQAAAGEPEMPEWHYRHGMALLQLGRLEEAHGPLKACLTIDPEHGYGGAQMGMAQVLGQAKQYPAALKALATYERNHGPIPESAFRRGMAHKNLGQKSEAQAAFEEVPKLAQETARYQKKTSNLWVLKAKLASLF